MGANKVIITVSIGVLQTNSIIFEPKLPTRKQNAISQLRIGQAEKIILVFKNNFWKKHGMYFVANTRNESMSYYDFSKYYGTPTLVAFAPADSIFSLTEDVDIVQ